MGTPRRVGLLLLGLLVILAAFGVYLFVFGWFVLVVLLLTVFTAIFS